MLTHIGQALQDNSVIEALNSTSWTAASIEIVHYFSMFVLVGLIAIVDLRVMGLAAKQQSLGKLGQRLFPWMWAALGLNFFSGFLMFGGFATAFIPDPIFHMKMWTVLAALVFTVVVQWRVPIWDKAPAIPAAAKLIAFLSLLLWIAAIIAGNEVPDLTGL